MSRRFNIWNTSQSDANQRVQTLQYLERAAIIPGDPSPERAITSVSRRFNIWNTAPDNSKKKEGGLTSVSRRFNIWNAR